jgi:hypothetical protein
MALSASLYRIENWNIKARDAGRITAAEIKHIRKTAEYTSTEYKANTKELNITPVLDKIQEYIKNYLQHINRTSHNRLPRILQNYRPPCRRNH